MMGNQTYYYELPEALNNLQPGIYCRVIEPNTRKYNRFILYHYSERVWVQGPKGGVRLIKEHGNPHIGYVTKNNKKMKEFIWVKLKAQEI